MTLHAHPAVALPADGQDAGLVETVSPRALISNALSFLSFAQEGIRPQRNAVPLLALFEKKMRLEVPLFQRQYVWNREAQWSRCGKTSHASLRSILRGARMHRCIFWA
jgi:hypothetical protein